MPLREGDKIHIRVDGSRYAMPVVRITEENYRDTFIDGSVGRAGRKLLGKLAFLGRCGTLYPSAAARAFLRSAQTMNDPTTHHYFPTLCLMEQLVADGSLSGPDWD